MLPESPWCIIVNLQTCNFRKWKKWQSLLDTNKIAYQLYFTHSISELSVLLDDLFVSNNKYYLFAGGDGTLHHGGNLLFHHAAGQSRELVIGLLPCGTGNDWVRTFGVAHHRMIESLRYKKTVPLNVLKLQWPDGSIRFAFNMVGGGLDAAVVNSIDNSNYRFGGFLKYPVALLRTLMKPHKWSGTIVVDDKSFEGDWLTIEAGFGKYCGGGMYVLPHASANSAALLLMKPKSLARIFTSIQKLYDGKIGDQEEAITMSFSKIEILTTNHHIPIEADGEWLGYSPVTISTEMGIMQRIV